MRSADRQRFPAEGALFAKALIQIQDVHLKPLLGGEEDARRAVEAETPSR
jgi:hypothetical protein